MTSAIGRIGADAKSAGVVDDDGVDVAAVSSILTFFSARFVPSLRVLVPGRLEGEEEAGIVVVDCGAGSISLIGTAGSPLGTKMSTSGS